MNFRPKPFYFLTDAAPEVLTREAITERLRQLAALGFGGLVLFNKPPNGFSLEEFLGPRWFRCVRDFAEISHALDLELWINDGFDYPPGDAGGRIAAVAPELKQRYLALGTDGTVEVREADWGFPAFEEAESSRWFVELVYEEYRRQVGDLFGCGIVGFFSDADGRRVTWQRYERMQKSHYFPWCRDFSSRFHTRFGYALEPHLGAILRHGGGQAAVDYWRLAGELYQNWFAGNYQWCREHGLQYTFHSSDLGPRDWHSFPRSSIFNEGDYFHQANFCDWVGTDHELAYLNGVTTGNENFATPCGLWGGAAPRLRGGEHYRNVRTDIRAKLAASAAWLYRKKGAMCEMFAGTDWSATPMLLRDIAAWQIMQGINFIVPHAVHHRLTGVTKYFAPPDFSPHNNWAEGMAELNAYLSFWCEAASVGEWRPPIALLLDVAEQWDGTGTADRFFQCAEALNRLPHGYVVVPVERLLEEERSFEFVVNTASRLDDAVRAACTARGIRILEAAELGRLPALPEVRWEGRGQPHFMRRTLPEGEVLLLANIEDEFEISGTLYWQGRTYAVALASGELAMWSPRGDHYRTPRPDGRRCWLPERCAVMWSAPNLIPVRRWETPDGSALAQSDAAEVLDLQWEVVEPVGTLEFRLPEVLRDRVAAVELDGRCVDGVRRAPVFDEQYLGYDLPDGGTVGTHHLRLIKTGAEPWAWELSAYLAGEFDVEVLVGGRVVQALWHFVFSCEIPEFATVKLRRRRTELSTHLSWAEQGHPFFSGAATYCCDVELPQVARRAVLGVPEVQAIAALCWDEVALGRRIWAPFEWELPECRAGRHTVRLTVKNTLANQLIGCRFESGLSGGWYLEFE